MSEVLVSKAVAGVSHVAVNVARSLSRQHHHHRRRRANSPRLQPASDPPESQGPEHYSPAEQATWRETRRRIFKFRGIIMECKKEREGSPVDQYSTAQRKRRMRNRLRSRIHSTQELLRSFYDDLDMQPLLSEHRSQYLRFHVSEAENLIGVMQRRYEALVGPIWYLEDSAGAVKVEMSEPSL